MLLVTGFPNSGTSFAAELVVRLGFSPGSKELLKQADDHNPYGYWEHLGLKEIIRRPTHYREKLHPLRSKLPLVSIPRNEKLAERVREYAELQGIEVFKDTGIPILWRLFPSDSKCIILRRHPSDIWKRHYYKKFSWPHFEHVYDDYHQLVRQMAKEVSCLTLWYETFGKRFSYSLEQLCDFLDVDMAGLDVKRLRKIYRPK